MAVENALAAKRAASRPAGSIKVTIVRNEDEASKQRFLLKPDSSRPIRIGRGFENEVRVDLLGVSTLHAEIRLSKAAADAAGADPKKPARPCVRDLSTNGTGLKLPKGQKVLLKNGVDTPLPNGSELLLPLRAQKGAETEPGQERRALLKIRLERVGSLPPPQAPAPPSSPSSPSTSRSVSPITPPGAPAKAQASAAVNGKPLANGSVDAQKPGLQATAAPTQAEGGYSKGQEILIFSNSSNAWKRGTITRITGDGTIVVMYDNFQKKVPRTHHVKLLKPWTGGGTPASSMAANTNHQTPVGAQPSALSTQSGREVQAVSGNSRANEPQPPCTSSVEVESMIASRDAQRNSSISEVRPPCTSGESTQGAQSVALPKAATRAALYQEVLDVIQERQASPRRRSRSSTRSRSNRGGRKRRKRRSSSRSRSRTRTRSRSRGRSRGRNRRDSRSRERSRNRNVSRRGRGSPARESSKAPGSREPAAGSFWTPTSKYGKFPPPPPGPPPAGGPPQQWSQARAPAPHTAGMFGHGFMSVPAIPAVGPPRWRPAARTAAWEEMQAVDRAELLAEV